MEQQANLLAVPDDEPEAPAGTDLREVSRVVATVLLASGTPSAEDVARGNQGLARLGRPPLAQHDATPATPEELARAVPREVRGFVSDLLFGLAGDDPLRRRVAESYSALWGRAAPSSPP